MARKNTNIIVGHTTDTTVKIWTKASSAEYPGSLILYIENKKVRHTGCFYTSENAFTSTITLTDLKPDTQYSFILTINKEEWKGSFRTFKANNQESELQFLFSSCLLNHNLLIRKKHRVFKNLTRVMQQTNASFMQFCGDQVYVDTLGFIAPKDPNYEAYEKKYIDNWSLKGAADFFANNSSYMILDDHEIANDFDNSRTELLPNKKFGMLVYDDYQHAHNPDTEPGQFYYNYRHGTYEVFVLDTRSERDRSKGQIISIKQMDTFLKWLELKQDRMKIVVSPVPFILQPKGRIEKWGDPVFKDQYMQVMNKLIELEDEKVLFVTGDYHSAIHSTFIAESNSGKTMKWHEFMAGPLNQAIVNPAMFFEEELQIASIGELVNNYSLRFVRQQVECDYTNVGSVKITSDENHYYVQGSWYRAQHESKAALIANATLIKINK